MQGLSGDFRRRCENESEPMSDTRTQVLEAMDAVESAIVKTVNHADNALAALFIGDRDRPQLGEPEARSYDQPERQIEAGEEVVGEVVDMVERNGLPCYAMA